MAILKDVVTPHGVTARYHKIIKAEIDAEARIVRFTVRIYASAEARAANGMPLWHEYPTIPFDAFTVDPLHLLYPALARYSDSYLSGGVSDPEGEDVIEDFSIRLRPEVAVAEQPAEPEPLTPTYVPTTPPGAN